MFFSTDNICALWALVWGWVTTHYPIIIVGLLTVVLVLPVVLLATKTIVHAFCHHGGIRDNNILPVAVRYHGKTANARHGVARPATGLHSRMEALEEGLPVSPEMPPSNILQMTFPDIQPPPCRNEVRMIKKLREMYTMLVKTLDGATNSLSAVERMNAACSLVSKTVANLNGWRASAAIMALLQPAKDVTDLFSRRSMKNGSGAMSKGRQAHYVALLKQRAEKMEEALVQALWAETMPAVPTDIPDAVPIIALAENLGPIGHKKSNTTSRLDRKAKAAVAPGVKYVPYEGAFQLPDSSVLQ